jgi:hypothetical protein
MSENGKKKKKKKKKKAGHVIYSTFFYDRGNKQAYLYWWFTPFNYRRLDQRKIR